MMCVGFHQVNYTQLMREKNPNLRKWSANKQNAKHDMCVMRKCKLVKIFNLQHLWTLGKIPWVTRIRGSYRIRFVDFPSPFCLTELTHEFSQVSFRKTLVPSPKRPTATTWTYATPTRSGLTLSEQTTYENNKPATMIGWVVGKARESLQDDLFKQMCSVNLPRKAINTRKQ